MFSFLVIPLLLIVNFIGLGIYVYSIYYAFSVAGIVVAIVTAAIPGLAQIYWIYEITMDTGNLMNEYNQACAAFVIGWVLLCTIIYFKEAEER